MVERNNRVIVAILVRAGDSVGVGGSVGKHVILDITVANKFCCVLTLASI